MSAQPSALIQACEDAATRVQVVEGAELFVVVRRSDLAQIRMMAEALQSAVKNVFELQPIQNPMRLDPIEVIQATTADHYRITMDQLLGDSRHEHVAWPRMVAACLANRLLPQHSLAAIAERFGYLCHTSICHACKAVDARLFTDANEKAKFEALEAFLRKELAV